MTKSTRLATKDACNYLKVSRKTYQKYVRQGWIKAVMEGNKWVVEVDELNRFLKEGPPPIDIKSLQAKPAAKKARSNTKMTTKREKPYSYDPQKVFEDFKSLDLTLPSAKNMSLDEYKSLIVKKIKGLPHIREEHASAVEDYARECVIVESISKILETKRDATLLGDNPGPAEKSFLLKDYESALARKLKLADELLLTPKAQTKLHPDIWKKLFVYSKIEVAENISTFMYWVLENDEILGSSFSNRREVLFTRIERLVEIFLESKMTFGEWKEEEWPQIRENFFSREEI